MLTDKEYLLLCEIASNGILNTNKASIGEVTKLLISKDKCDNRALIEEASSSSNLEVLKLKDSKRTDEVKVFILQDLSGNDFVVFVGKENLESINSSCFEEIYGFVKQNIDMESCYITGLKTGGVYAAYTASRLDAKAVVFGAPCFEELAGNIINFIAENEPVGEYLKNVVFVRQKIIDESIDKPYSEMLEFDEKGKAVEGVQTEYSKFCSWLYRNAGAIDNKVWELFFNSTGEEDGLIDKDIYSVFFRVSELNEERIKNALKNVVKHIENELEKNIRAMKAELEKNIFDIDGQDFSERICEITENTSQIAADIVTGAYKSVEIILMGVGLFTLGNKTIDNAALMEQFSKDLDSILNKEEQCITDILKNGKEQFIEMLASFPEVQI